ncbi:general stress protein [Macrococcoides caseolyticum]|uniref:general stress protein n=1 Tax=Macrococcoides caseolyticum TaxID=69966 RepID=UPI001F37F14B|nr:general stress protein [Macrococcus caseolyticus]MCE4956421.1 general stress protein [Macrococcus caseolyticus]
MKFIETFTSEQPLHGKIDQLREEGIDSRDLYIVSKNKIDGLALIDQDVNFISADRNTTDHIKSFFTGDDVINHHYDTHHITNITKEAYKMALDAGQLLLFIKPLGEQQ